MNRKDLVIGIALGITAAIIANVIIHNLGLNTQTVKTVRLLEEQNELLRMNLHTFNRQK